MGIYIKLNGENIIGHCYDYHPGVNPADYDALVNSERLVNDDGDYKYKYSGGELVELNEGDIDSQPTNVEKHAETKFDRVRSLILTRLALLAIIDHPAPPAAMKTRAQNKLTAVNQQIAAELGL